MYELLAQDAPGLVETLTSAAAQVPALAVLCLVVYVFLAHIKDAQKLQADRDKAWEDRTTARDGVSRDFHRELSENMHEALEESKTVIKENTTVLSGVKDALNRKGLG
jgi:hypothetical protein